MTVKDARGRLVYEVGRIEGDQGDLRDKVLTRVRTRDDARDAQGRPLGVFGADVIDGPDVPRWSPNPIFGGTTFRGRGLVNFQNGFLRCVKCIGIVDAAGRCQPAAGQGATRADRFAKRHRYQEAGVALYWVVDGDGRQVEVWTPEAELPVVETERVVWRPAGAGGAFTLELEDLFREI